MRSSVPFPRFPPRWVVVVLPCLAALFGGSIAAYVAADRPPIGTDPAFFQHTGWYVVHGATPYVDVWDVNPPLTFGVAAALALVAGGNMFALHALSAGLMILVVAAAVLLTGWLAYDVTGDDAAAVVAGFVMLLPPPVYGLPPYGIRSQYLALLFGVLGLALVRRRRPFAAGASVAASAAFWQPSAGLAPLVVGVAAQRGGRSGALWAVAGGGSVAALVVLPFAAAGALVPMLLQTVAAPLYGHAPFSLPGRGYELVLELGYGVAVAPLAFYGWLRVARDRRAYWWVPAGGLLFGAQILLVNLNGSLDLLLWLVFVALGVAIAVESRPSRRQWAIAAAVGLIVLTGPLWHLAPVVPLEPAVEERRDRAQPDQRPALAAAESSVPDVRTIYWQKLRPETCHYRLSWTELRWIAGTGAQLDEERCGQWLG